MSATDRQRGSKVWCFEDGDEVRLGLKGPTLLGSMLGEGGEARIFRLPDHPDCLAKLFKLPVDPEFEGDEDAKQAARIRVVVHQTKLRLFPRDLPDWVAAPKELIYDPGSGLIVGFLMHWAKGGQTLASLRDPSIRKGVTDRQVLEWFASLREAILFLHGRQFVIGDFNDSNVLLMPDGSVVIIDADSMQIGPYHTRMFTPGVVDPRLCKYMAPRRQKPGYSGPMEWVEYGDRRADPNAPGSLQLIQYHDHESDWYAFWVMLFQSIYGVGPFGGTYRPKKKSQRLQPGQRGLLEHLASVYRPDVIYPRSARPLDSVSAALDRSFRKVFTEGKRPIPPEHLLDPSQCGADGMLDPNWRPVQIVAVPTKTGQKVGRFQAKEVYIPGSGERILQARPTVRRDADVLSYRPDELLLNDQVLTTLRWSDSLSFTLGADGGRFVSIAAGPTDAMFLFSPTNGGQRVVNKLHLAAGVDSRRPLVIGSSLGLVYYGRSGPDQSEDLRLWCLLGRLEPKLKELEGIERDSVPIDLWTDGEDLLFVLFERKNGGLGYLLYHLVWGRVLYARSFTHVTRAAEIDRAACLPHRDHAWLALRTAAGESFCELFDKRGAVKLHVDFDEQDPTAAQLWSNLLAGRAYRAGQMLFILTDDELVRLQPGSGGVLERVGYPLPQPGSGRDRWLLPAKEGVLAVGSAGISQLMKERKG